MLGFTSVCVLFAWLPQVRILQNLKHPNVINIYQFFKDDPGNYYVVIEFMKGGELFDRIVKKVSISRLRLSGLPRLSSCVSEIDQC